MSRLRLREVRLSGFKTFADKTTIAFTPGITAIVGPNGSGKSNIVDALRWSLGEAGRGIRSKRVDEVIFAGSEKRRQLGLAEVSLSIDNSDGLFDLPFGEIEIARRADRGGGQEYLLNRERVRLRDLTELLDGAGLAENGLLFIGQGAVDQALSLRSEERRALIEEFAGTARHERRRARADTEMKEATENRARVEEIMGALRPQERRLASLARQESGREELLTEAVERIARLGAQRGAWLASRGRRVRGGLDAARASLDATRSALRSADAVAQERRDRLTAARSDLAAARLDLEGHRATREAAERSLARAEAESAALDRDLARLDAEVVAAEADVRSVEALRAAAAPSVDADAAASLELVDADLAAARREVEALTADAGGDDAGALLRALRARDAEIAELDARAERAAAELQAVQSDAAGDDLPAAERASAEAASQATAAAAALSAATNAASTAEARLAAARAVATDRDAAARSAAAEVAALRGRLEALEGRRTALQERALAKAARAIGGRSLLAGVEIREEGRAAVLAALGALARGFIVDRRGASLLDDEQGALFIEGSSAPVLHSHPNLPSLDGEVLSDPDGILARLLAGVSIAPDIATALDLLDTLPAGGVIVTRSGAVIRAGGVVSRETEPEDALLDNEIARLSAEVDRRAAAAQRLTDEAATASSVLVGIAEQIDAARRTEGTARSAARTADGERAEAERRRDLISRRVAERTARIERLRSAIAGTEERLREIAGSSNVGTRGVGAAGTREALETWQRRIDELSARRGALAAAVEADTQALRSWELERARGDATISAASARISRAAAERGALEARGAALRAELGEISGRAEAARIAFTERDQRVAVLAAAQIAIESEIAADDDQKRRLRAEEEALDLRMRPLERESQSLDFEEERLLEELAGDLATFGRRLSDDVRIAAGIPAHLRGGDAQATSSTTAADGAAASPGDDAADASSRERRAREQATALFAHWSGVAAGGNATESAAPDPEELRALERLRRKIGPLEAGGASIAIEHRELRERLESLESQAADLDGAIAKAAQLMEELDRLVESTFSEQFTALQASFSTNFQLLFGGGDAQLRLVEDGGRRAGVEIDARPPLKRRQQLSLLSGGERALTGVALLLGMLAVRPLPFVVLDEVDAALDEANVTRFGDAIRELSERTQVIVITHNRGTVEVADSLWGVTVGEDAASRVFGLRLDEAKRIADQARAEREAAR